VIDNASGLSTNPIHSSVAWSHFRACVDVGPATEALFWGIPGSIPQHSNKTVGIGLRVDECLGGDSQHFREAGFLELGV
jgi:hypothetical protein